MNLKIKLVDNTLLMPEYKTPGAVAFDFYSRIDMEIQPLTPTIVPSNFIIKVPKNFVLMVSGRSSLPKLGLIIGNAPGIIDQDYSGENDEIGLFIINLTQKAVKIEKGQRLAQGTLVKIAKAEKFVHVKKMDTKSRGGFGTTGKK